MSGYATNSPEFIAAVDALPGKYASRLDEQGLYLVRTALQAGEWREGLEELIVRLAERRSTVTQAERDELATLCATADVHASLLDELPA